LLPFSWPILAALPVLLLVISLLSHAGVVPWWWRALPPARAVAWVLADFLALSAAAAVAGWLPGLWAVPVAGLAGLFNARAWYGVTMTLTVPQPGRARSRRQTRLVPVAPLAALAAVALVIGVARLGFAVGAGGPHTATAAAAPGLVPDPGSPLKRQAAGRAATRDRQPVLEIEGFGSSCCSGPRALRALSPGGIVRQFSYAGLDARGRPLPYGRGASDLPLAVLGDRITAQVRWLHRLTGKPVDIVAESEGSLGVDAMLARHPDVPLGSVILLSPILAPGQVRYPAGDAAGAGMVPGYALHAMVGFIGSISPYGGSGMQTLVSSVNRTGARFAGVAAALARHRQMRWLAVVPLADSLTLPACTLPAGTVVIPALHGGLASDPLVQRIVRRFFAGQQVQARTGLQGAAETIAGAATAWRMPEPARSAPTCLSLRHSA
ncbi:MAG: hypothetical protein ACRDNZ_11900, partial [Streptosporangiaceae bacterium]